MNEAQRLHEEREAFVMGRQRSSWLILRVFHGNPLLVEKAVNEVGLAQAYCPRETVKRRHPAFAASSGKVIEHTRPLIPGYCFTDREFDVDHLRLALIATAKAKAESRQRPNQPRTSGITAKFMMWGESYLTLGEREMNQIRKAEIEQSDAPKRMRELIEGVTHALRQVAIAVTPQRYVALSDFQALAKTQQRGIYPSGRAA